jgi:hypothetical protein
MAVSARSEASAQLTELVYELLDAHEDTLRLSEDVGETAEWAAHRAYLRDLHRAAHAALARLRPLDLADIG